MNVTLNSVPVRFQANQPQSQWKAKLDQALCAEYEQWLVSRQDKSVDVAAVLHDNVQTGGTFSQRLTKAGLVNPQILQAVGIVAGGIPVSRLQQLAQLKEIMSIEQTHEATTQNS